ncbi:Acyl-CoA-binding domain-containing protein 2 [Coemansia sp. RSA 2706]|nr:Acyl-CoA-binding domain-containing protein 2 [Coemansia sp. RSA 2706]
MSEADKINTPSEALVKDFEKAAEEVKDLPSATNDEKLDLYGLFKQANTGDNDTDRPGAFNFTGRAKWDAWTKNKGTDKKTAMEKYIELVKKLQKEAEEKAAA